MDSEIQLVTNGDGLAVIGEPAAVEEFLISEGLWSASKDLGQRLKSVLGAVAVVAQVGSEIAANSGRWLKMTSESAHLCQKYGLRQASNTGLSTGVVLGRKPGQIRTFLQFEKGARSLLNPAVLSGVAGIMAQVAMQQSIAEITAYLARIDAKVDDVLRKQDDAVLARMTGAGDVIERAMTIRDHKGRVAEIEWSTVQNTPGTIAHTQRYALRQLEAIAGKMEHATKVRGLAKTAEEAEREVQEWLAVLARCFQLQDAFDVIELDRVMDTSPEELDAHRRGQAADRRKRLDRISLSTTTLLDRINVAVGTANANMLLHPVASPAVVDSSNQVAAGVRDFQMLLGIESDRQRWKARPWTEAAMEAKDKALENAGPVATGIAVGSFALALKVLHDRSKKS